MAVYKQKNRRTFMMDFVFKGRRIYESTGERDKRRAQRVEEQRKNDLRDGARGLRQAQQFTFLGEAATAWREWAPRPRGKRTTPWSPSMCGIADSTMRRILAFFGKDRLLADIDERDIHRYQDARQADTPRPANRSINIELSTLRKILKKAGHWERIKGQVGELKEREDVGRALTQEQERMLLEECGRSVSRALLPFVTLALDSGARYNTIRTLQWGRVDLEKGLIKIGRDKTDAGSGRVVPLNGRALQTLRHWAAQFPNRKPDHFVFPSELFGLIGKKGVFGGEVKVYNTDPTRPGSIKSAWETARERTRWHCPQCRDGRLQERRKATGFICDKCKAKFDTLPEGASTFRFHDCRHTAASRMLAAGQPLPVIAKVLGWRLGTVAAMAERYGHFEEDALRRAVESIAPPPPPPGETPLRKALTGRIQ